MAIEFDLTKLPKQLLDDDAEYQVTDKMIWNLAFTGMANPNRAFEEKDVAEFYARQRLLAQIHGDTPFTVEQVRARVGMKVWVTNIGLQHLNGEPRSAWLKRVCGGQMDEWKRLAEAKPVEAKESEAANV